MSAEPLPRIGPQESSPEPRMCPLCGDRFTEDGYRPCNSCPLNTGCRLACCPNCGYTFPTESRVVNWLQRVLRRNGKKP